MAVLTATEQQVAIASELKQVDAATVLALAMTDAQGNLTVVSAAGFPAVPFSVYIDAEKLLVTAVAGAVFTILRAQGGTAAAAHAAGARVVYLDPDFELQLLSAWANYEDLAGLHPRLRGLYAKLDMVRYLIGFYHDMVNWKDGDRSRSDSDLAGNLKGLLALTEKQIEELNGQLGAARGPAVGDLTRQAPIERADGVPFPREAHDRMYRGDPWRRS